MGQNNSTPNNINDSTTINIKRRRRVKENKNASTEAIVLSSIRR